MKFYKKVAPGMRFGFLVVTNPSDRPRSKTCGAYWDCVCDCGGSKQVTMTSLYKVKVPPCHKIMPVHIGERFGLLVVESPSNKKGKARGSEGIYWNCICDCGGTKTISVRGLTRGKMPNCGCLLRQDRGGLIKRHPRTVVSWNQMLRRCTLKTNKEYKNYGGRGITVCDRWKVFANFLADMGPRPLGRTLDRAENSKGYYKDNCRWATPKEQTLNRAKTHWLEIDGERLCVTDWARHIGIKHPEVIWHKSARSRRTVEDICAERVRAFREQAAQR